MSLPSVSPSIPHSSVPPARTSSLTSIASSSFPPVARLGALPLLGPLLLAVDALLVGLLTALAPVVGGLLANVSALVFSLGGSNLAGLIANLGAGLTAGLLTLAV